MNLWNLWIQYIEYLCDLFNQKKFWKLILHILLILFCLFSFTMVVSGILYLVSANWETITTVVGCIVIVALFVLGFFPKKKAVPDLPEPTQASYDPVFLNQHIQLVENEPGFCSCRNCGYALLACSFYSQPDWRSCALWYCKQCRYLSFPVRKTRAVCQNRPVWSYGNHSERVGTTLEQPWTDRDKSTTTFYNGMAYPAIMDDNVQDLGRYIQIDVAITNESYLRYRTNRLYSNMNDSNTSNPYDRNF